MNTSFPDSPTVKEKHIDKVKIRRILPEESNIFHQLKLAALIDSPEIFVATLEEESQKTEMEIKKFLKQNYALGAYLENSLRGTLTMMEQSYSKFSHIGILGGMYVEPDYRNLGIGKKLLTQMLEDIKKFPHIESLQLKVLTSNKIAIKLYESFGFFKWASEKKALKFKGKYFDQFHFEKWIK